LRCPLDNALLYATAVGTTAFQRSSSALFAEFWAAKGDLQKASNLPVGQERVTRGVRIGFAPTWSCPKAVKNPSWSMCRGSRRSEG